MTEEDQKLVAMAALHGAQFISRKNNYGTFWQFVEQEYTAGRCTIGRAAMDYLQRHDLVSPAEYIEYMDRSGADTSNGEIDPALIARVLA